MESRRSSRGFAPTRQLVRACRAGLATAAGR
jgi:hypothetical protein